MWNLFNYSHHSEAPPIMNSMSYRMVLSIWLSDNGHSRCDCQNAASVPPVSNSRLAPLPHERADFYDGGATVDIPLDTAGSKYQVGLGLDSLLLFNIICSLQVILVYLPSVFPQVGFKEEGEGAPS